MYRRDPNSRSSIQGFAQIPFENIREVFGYVLGAIKREFPSLD